MPAYPASYRGVSDQHLQTRGGERWPGNDAFAGDAARRPGGPSRRALRPAHAAGRQAVVWRPCRKARRLKNGSPPGALRSKPHKHRARDALGLADLRHYRFRQASMSRGVEARRVRALLVCARRVNLSALRARCVPRALGISFEERAAEWECGLPGAGQRIRAMAHGQIHIGSSTDGPATIQAVVPREGGGPSHPRAPSDYRIARLRGQ